MLTGSLFVARVLHKQARNSASYNRQLVMFGLTENILKHSQDQGQLNWFESCALLSNLIRISLKSVFRQLNSNYKEINEIIFVT